MHRHKTLLLVTAVTLAAGPAWADAPAETDAATLAAAKITLSVAIAEAEKHVQGKAVDAELEKADGKAIYEVEVAAGDKTFDVTVDAATGGVVTSKEDQDDHKEGDKDD